MKTIIFKNKINGEQYVCEDYRAVDIIDGIEYITVHRINTAHNFKIRRDAVDLVKTVDNKQL